jgi:nucleoside-diphosphate-sugar epimerase
MKCLVTGGTGFTGKALCLRLLKEGHAVVSLDYKEGLKTGELRQAGAEVIIGSVTDAAIVARAMAGIDTVYHLAAAFREMNVPNSFYDEVNVGGMRTVADAAVKAGVRRLIYCSTCGVHGNIDNPPAGEDAPIQPADYYQRTKYQGEEALQAYTAKGLKWTILRPAAIYGPGDPERFMMIFRRAAKGWFPMFGGGRTTYHPLYIDNLVDAFLLATPDGKGDGQAYLIADAEYFEIRELVRRAGLAMGKPVRIVNLPVWPLVVLGHVCEKVCAPFHVAPPIFPRRVDWYRQNRAFKIDKARRDLGYDPKVGIDEGLRRTAEWYKAEGYLKG